MLAMQKRSYRTGEVLFQEGQEGKAVFIIQSGQVELTRTVDQKPRSVGIMKPGQMFGEMALLEQMKRSATATVVEDGDIYLLYTTTLETLIKDYPSIGVKLLRNMAIMLSALLRRTNRELDERMKSHS
jgi:CRP-like cAMP-binding protein